MHPIVKPLSLWRRKIVFALLLLAFLLCLPVFIFYATGYRYDFSDRTPIFTATGGFYVSAEAPDNKIYIDDELVTNARTFRDASYIQGLEPGRHRLHVQAPGMHTWVKELEVYPHIVTEVESFNIPLVPQVRLVSQYVDSSGQAVFSPGSTSTAVFSVASTTNEYTVATTTSTSSLRSNQEFTLLQDLFDEQASTTALRAALKEINITGTFGFSTTSAKNLTLEEEATSTVARDALSLIVRGEDIYAVLQTNNTRLIPNYFCSEQMIVAEAAPDTIPKDGQYETVIPVTVEVSDRLNCRTEIKIDRKGKAVVDFDFSPMTTNLVILQLTDGIYVTEVDDRVWQNSQILYGGDDLEFIVYREGIYIRQGEIIFEILTQVAV